MGWEAALGEGETAATFREREAAATFRERESSTARETSATGEAASATGEAGELHLLFYGFLDTGLPVFVETLDVLVEEGEAVGNPFLQDGNLLFVGTDAIVGEHTDGVESAFTHTETAARETASTESAKAAEAALGLGGLL